MNILRLLFDKNYAAEEVKLLYTYLENQQYDQLIKNINNISGKDKENVVFDAYKHAFLHIQTSKSSINGKWPLVDLFYSVKFDLNATSRNGDSLLHEFIKIDKEICEDKIKAQVIRYLLIKGVSMKCQDVRGDTPLHCAITYDSKIILNEFLNYPMSISFINIAVKVNI